MALTYGCAEINHSCYGGGVKQDKAHYGVHLGLGSRIALYIQEKNEKNKHVLWTLAELYQNPLQNATGRFGPGVCTPQPTSMG